MLEINYTLNEINAVAKQILKHATFKNFIFKAEMGAGKTTLIKTLVKSLECTDNVSSPTFSLVNEYHSKTNIIYHFDLYRVKTEDELYNFGIEDYLNKDAYLFIEWPELIENFIENYHTISIRLNKNNSRTLKMF